MTRYTRSGRFISSKFESICNETGKTILKGESCLFFPETKEAFHIDSDAVKKFNAMQIK